MAAKAEMIEIENVNQPGKTYRVEAAKYEAMKQAMLKELPKGPPGMLDKELREAVLAHLPEDLFPGGAKAGWWRKGVQLDLEAKGIISRGEKMPLRLCKV